MNSKLKAALEAKRKGTAITQDVVDRIKAMSTKRLEQWLMKLRRLPIEYFTQAEFDARVDAAEQELRFRERKQGAIAKLREGKKNEGCTNSNR